MSNPNRTTPTPDAELANALAVPATWNGRLVREVLVAVLIWTIVISCEEEAA